MKEKNIPKFKDESQEREFWELLSKVVYGSLSGLPA
jgi:hypothetical protein